ncbi:MAG: diaminopimelate dehydrogenase [Lautropia sp.]|nr:MAG: diaminopimelate dehydrogenase [Pseudomonadota bacterium]MBC6960004.1 diaminopimelate dehydrogenase [Lautropia sp.]MCL4701912.1 diaminopimelate dehydrogenase [Burkholderiaceae bacterium]MCZ2412786.1 diaminopimelate dehydrogenase [Burkholderiales bacterium]MDL1907522.1 diaminopimelate dehydrogenase [Betaproteobacteria bacterium PRO1]
MGQRIRIGIAGYGNLGRGVEAAIAQNPDTAVAGVFTRRDPASVRTLGAQVHRLDAIDACADAIDVLVLCGGSKSDLPEQGPALAARFNTVDSFDTHARIPEYFDAVDRAARANDRTAVIAVGWDPGLFSLARAYGESVLADGATYTFWGRGVSQGHSDAIRRVPGVRAGVQYTVPVPQAIERVRSGARPALSTREKHTRECYVVLEEGADAAAVERAIVTMPDYFADYDTTVRFVDAETLRREHSAMPHGGFVLRTGRTGHDTTQVLEFALRLQSNPEFTASVLVAYARAAFRLAQRREFGAHTVFDIAPALLSSKSPAELRAQLL